MRKGATKAARRITLYGLWKFQRESSYPNIPTLSSITTQADTPNLPAAASENAHKAVACRRSFLPPAPVGNSFQGNMMNPISRSCSLVLTKIFGIDRLALVLCAFAAPALSAAEFPAQPQDPRLAEVYLQARALLDKARSPGYMDPPDTTKPWPCAIVDLEIRTYGGALNEEELKAVYAKNKQKLPRTGNAKVSIRDVRYAPVSASCKDGKLDGPLEFVMEFTRVIDTYAYVMEVRYRVRKHLRVKSGEMVAGTQPFESTLQISQKVKYKNPAQQEQMDKHYRANPFKKTLSVNYAVPAQVGGKATYYTVGFREAEGGAWETTLSWPTGPGRTSIESYRGTALSMTMRMKNNKSHGEMRFYETTPDGKSVLKSTTCHEDGEQIKTTDCKVD